MIYAFRILLQSSACILCAASALVLSGCTPTAGTDIGVSTYGITAAPVSAPNQITAESAIAANQSVLPLANATDVTTGAGKLQAGGQGFAPGNLPPSAVLPEALASATSLNTGVGAVANSANFVTDGVVKTVDASKTKPAPLTPSDLAGQVPSPLPSVAPTQQTASLDVAAPAASVADPVVAPKSNRSARAAEPTLFGNLFGKKPKKAQQSLTASPVEPDVQVASLETSNEDLAQPTESMSSLPGVKTKNLFALDPALNSGDEPFDDEPEVQLASASAAGLARLAPNGLLKQTDRVDVACFKPQLLAVLKTIENHYGKKVVVTSGYRSSTGNRRAGGSRNSLHISCAAADIQIQGVGKWQLAKYLRTMPGRGGVGTYCHTDSVHIDIGSERDWNWRCRRR